VRFAPQNLSIYPLETSIAVSFSPSSRGSSSSYPSNTEAPYVFFRTPRQQSQDPVKHARCHPLLMTSAITYDLRDPILTATTTHNNSWLSIETLHQPAFNPSLSRITITSSYLPWTIKVHPSNASYITLQDVLFSIHSVFRTNITHTEFQLLPSHHHRRRATHAYQQRYRRLRHQYENASNSDVDKASESEKYAGMKRVDFLMGHTKFLGISSKGCQPNEWHLHVTSSTMAGWIPELKHTQSYPSNFIFLFVPVETWTLNVKPDRPWVGRT